MTLVQIELNDDEVAHLDALADREKRARKHQAAKSLMLGVATEMPVFLYQPHAPVLRKHANGRVPTKKRK